MPDRLFWILMYSLLISGVGFYSYVAGIQDVKYNNKHDASKKQSSVPHWTAKTKN